MINVTVKVMGPLIKITGGSTISIELPDESTVWDLLDVLFERFGEEMKNEVMEEGGLDLAPYYKVLINGRNSKLMEYLETVLEDGQVVHVMPPIAGG